MIQEAEALLARFVAQNVEFVIIGGICNVLHGATLVTKDVDVCCRFTRENLKRIEAAVKELNPIHRQTPNQIPFELTDELAGRLKNLYLRTDAGVIDCLGEVAGLGDFDAVLQESILVRLPFGECRMLSIEALIRSKETLGRDQDKIAVRQLRAIKERNDNRKR
jgi:hypothetical protein